MIYINFWNIYAEFTTRFTNQFDIFKSQISNAPQEVWYHRGSVLIMQTPLKHHLKVVNHLIQLNESHHIWFYWNVLSKTTFEIGIWGNNWLLYSWILENRIKYIEMNSACVSLLWALHGITNHIQTSKQNEKWVKH